MKAVTKSERRQAAYEHKFGLQSEQEEIEEAFHRARSVEWLALLWVCCLIVACGAVVGAVLEVL